MSGPDSSLVADLTAGYDTDVDQSPWGLTPRMALRLVIQAQFVADLARGNPDYFTLGDWVLPEIVRDQATPEFLERFHQCFEDLIRRLRHPQYGSDGLAQCVGDEVALRHVVALARDAASDGSESVETGPEFSLLPASPEFDDEFEFYEEVLFEDRDFDLLWSGDYSRLTDDDEASGVPHPVNLRPDRWFLPFRA